MIRPANAWKKLGISETTGWRYRKRPDFPRAYRLGPNVVVFSEDELDAWIAARRIDAGTAAATAGRADGSGDAR